MCLCVPGGLQKLFVCGGGGAPAQIVTDRSGEKDVVLQHDADVLSQ